MSQDTEAPCVLKGFSDAAGHEVASSANILVPNPKILCAGTENMLLLRDDPLAGSVDDLEQSMRKNIGNHLNGCQ